MSSKRQDFRRFCRAFFFCVQTAQKKFKKIQKIFPKPLDKSKNYAIIRVQKERNKQKMFQTFKNEEKTDAKVRIAAKGKSGKGSQGRDEREVKRRVRKAMIPVHGGAKA